MRVLLVDDHPVVREGVRSMLAGEEVEVVAEAATGAEAVERARALSPDVVLLDMQLPDMEGAAAIRQMRQSGVASAVLVLSMHDDPAMVRKAMDAGAGGYLLKGTTRGDLLAAMRAVRDGATVVDPSLRAALAAGDASALTPVERELLRLMAQGLTNREIADQRRWSVASVKKYVQRVLEKLGATDRTQAVAVAIRRGLV